MLISLPEKFEAKVAAIEESCDLKSLTISEMISKLQAQEQSMSIRSDDVTEGAFKARHKGRQPVKRDQKKQNFDQKGGDQKGKGKMDGSLTEFAVKGKFPPSSTCKRTNHLSKNCWYKGKPQIQCNFCRKWGYSEKFYRSKPNQIQSPPTQQANYSDEQLHAEDHLFMATQACYSASKDVWYVDSGCTSHMARDSSLFTSLNRTDRTRVKLGNGEMVQEVVQYGHFNMNALRHLQSHDMVRDMPTKLELMHTDLCGPMSVSSLSENKYFILFINDLTRMTWVYFLSSKAQTFNVFKKFRAMVESDSGCNIKKLWLDNGNEYTSNEFNAFCEEMGITHQLIVSYTSKKNGVLERKK
ncbi:hypothetical protein EZV62_010897 [Acer yangbiense]|uniref:Integrase catalytic domain-containing protein n=1 Tax=Acer yangbiense TaxID=1000413 RepID=A0A5C7I2Z9_9ROSI|nr:hypothetical protein EZV62_010897 [Acer yangbiense]